MTCCTPLSAWGWGRVKNVRKVFAGGGGEGVRNFYFLGGGGCYIVGRRVNFFFGGGGWGWLHNFDVRIKIA